MNIRPALEATLKDFQGLKNNELAKRAYELADMSIKLCDANNDPFEQRLVEAKIFLAVSLLHKRGVKLAI